MTRLEALYASYRYQVLKKPYRLTTQEQAWMEAVEVREILRALWMAGYEGLADRLVREEVPWSS